MTKLLKKAFENASKLPETEQNILARWLLGELKAERQWEKIIAESEDILSQLADEALEEHRQEKTSILNIDEL